MNEVLTWGAIIVAGGSIVAVVKFWMDQGRYQEKAELAVQTASAASARYELMVQQFADYRVAIEVKIAVVKTLGETNTAAMVSTETRLAKAMEEVRDQLRDFNSRIDRILERDREKS